MRQLVRDPFFVVALGLVAAPLAVYAWPHAQSSGFPARWAGSLADPCFLVLAIVTFVASWRPIAHPEERRFWALTLATCALWLAGNLAAFAEPTWGAPSTALLVRNIFYLLSYVTLVLAADLRPHLPEGWTRTSHGFPLAVGATLLCVVGIIVCFFALPLLLHPEAGWSWPALVTFQALDVLVLIRFLHLRFRASGTAWAPVYGWFLFASAAAALADGLNLLDASHRLKLAYGTPLDAIWWLPLIGFIAARRVRARHAAPAAVVAAVADEPNIDSNELLYLYALAFPAIHLTLSALGMRRVGEPVENLAVLAVLIAFVTLAVAQQRQLEQRHRDLRSRLRILVTNEQVLQSQKLEALGRMAGGLAHDFNNLLTVVLGRADMLRVSLAPGADRSGVEEILKAAERGAALTRELLAFSRNQVMPTRVLDLNAVTGQAVTMLQRIVGERYAIATELAAGLHPIDAEPNQMFQVLLNLVTNARDSMPAGGVITLRTHPQVLARVEAGVVPPTAGGAFSAIDVSDSGSGIDADTQVRMFDPFFTLKAQGTGLGLAVVYGIVAQSGGHLRVRSEPGRGTTLTVMFPHSAGPGTREEPAAPAVAASPARRHTILLVDDQPDVRAVTRGMLSALGYDVVEAEGGAEALALCRDAAAAPDTLLTDVVMPGMSGLEVAAGVRAMRPGIAVVFMSGFAESFAGELTTGEARGEFVSKPFTLESLRSALDAAVRG